MTHKLRLNYYKLLPLMEQNVLGMEHHALKDANNCLNTNRYSY
jgi:hypothetical protein